MKKTQNEADGGLCHMYNINFICKIPNTPETLRCLVEQGFVDRADNLYIQVRHNVTTTICQTLSGKSPE